MNIWQFLRVYRRGLILILTPVVLLPLPLFIQTAQANCAYVMLLMSTFWVTSVLHLAVVSLFPVVFFPLLGIMDSNTICMIYMKDTNVVYMACVILGIAIEHSKLHRRMALLMLLKIGTSPRRLLLGVMLTTMSISMWIMNTVAAAMMIPIVEAIFENLEKLDKSYEVECDDLESIELAEIDPDGQVLKAKRKSSNHCGIRGDIVDSKKKNKGYKTCVLLSVAYAANIGGTGTSTSTSPNIVFTQVVSMLYGHETGISYAKWMLFGVPNMLACILVSCGILQMFFMGFKKLEDSKKKAEIAQRTLKDEYVKLGSLTFHEGGVMTSFVTLVLLFFFRKPYFMPGWGSAIASTKVISDAVPAMILVLVMCAFPSSPSEAFNCKSHKPASSLLNWEEIQTKIPWDLILLQGSGYALAAGFKESGLDLWLGSQLASMETLPPTVLCFLLALMASFVTEVASNASTAAILLPIVAKMGEKLLVHPLYFMISITMCSSFSFMLPIATGPNAMVFKSGKMKSKDMLHVGFLTNLACVATMFVLLNSFGAWVYGLNTFPSWALDTRETASQIDLNATIMLTQEIKSNL